MYDHFFNAGQHPTPILHACGGRPNPFLFIRGLSCPRNVQTSLTQNCLKPTIPGFPYNLLPVTCGGIGFFKQHMLSIGLEIRPQSAFNCPL